MLAAALVVVSLATLTAVAWLFADGLAASLAHRRAARQRRAVTTPIALIVRSRTEHGNDLFTVELAAVGRRRLPDILPGQALALVIPAARTIRRRYSLAAWSPRPRRYRLGIRREADCMGSSWLHTHLVVGRRIDALPPAGHFVLDPAHRNLVLVGGGIGITPMMAMVDAIAQRPAGRSVWLHQAARYAHELIDSDRFESLAANASWFRYHPILSRADESWRGARGRLDARRLMAGPANPRAAHYYFCARESVMREWIDALLATGVPATHLHWESFGGAQNDDLNTYAIELDGARHAFTGQPSLLAAFEEWGVPLEAECRAGECGACRLRVLHGEVADCQPSQCTLPPGEILACCKVPRSSLTLARV